MASPERPSVLGRCRRAGRRSLWRHIACCVPLTGYGVPLPPQVSPPPGEASSPGKSQRIATEQSGASTAGKLLRLGSGEKLVVKDVITDADGSTNVRYNRTFDGLRVIGGDLVGHRDKSGKMRSIN
jgi:Fungalysin/Thermolysin Propeptide Motif